MSSSTDTNSNTKSSSTTTENSKNSSQSSVGESPTIRAIMSSNNNQHHQSNITYEDYDWMGVLDNLDDHSFMNNNNRPRFDSIDQLAASNSSTQLSSNGQHEDAVANLLTSQQQPQQGQNNGTATTTLLHTNVAASEQHQYQQQGSSATTSSSSTMPSLPSINSNINPPLISQPQPSNNSLLPQPSQQSQQPTNYKETEQIKKERKRTREKQRRLDTNEQFNALADIVKDIDNFDFNNERVFCLELYGPTGGSVNGGVNGSGGGLMNGGGMNHHQGMMTNGNGHQQQQQGGPTDNNIATDSHSQSKKLKSDYNINNNMNNNPTLLPPPLPKPSALGSRDTKTSQSSTLPQSSSTTLPAPTIQHPLTTTATTPHTTVISGTSSNRIDLIARTISQLSTFRTIRNTRNNELRFEKRRTCELRKENEELRRMVAHYKTVGMGKRLQEKVMMMVPMMVPHDQVSQIQQGYAVPHHSYGAASASASTTPSHFATSAPSSWATATAVSYHQAQPSSSAAAAAAGGVGGHPPQLNHSVSAPPDLQGPSTGDNSTQDPSPPSAGDYPPQQQQQVMVMAAQQPQPPQIATTTTTTAPPAMAMYPQVTNGVPSVAFGLHPHQPQTMSTVNPHVHPPTMTTQPQDMGVAANNNNASPQDGSTVDTTTVQLNGLPALQQQGFDRQASQGSTSSDKPAAATAAAHQVGGGGNLAHCA